MRKTVFAVLLMTLLVSVGTVAQQSGAEILVNRDNVNVRLFPAIGAEVIGFVDAGYRAPATGRSGDNQWIRIDFNGEEGWVGFPVINLFGDINALPVADPRSIPYGGFESPRSGMTSADSPAKGRLAQSGLRVRAGPSRAYPVLANAPRYTVMPLLGRTINNAWLQVNFEGTLGWIATQYVELQDGASIVSLPVDGIVADSQISSADTEDNYLGTLAFMLERVNLAQPSLDAIRGTWTTVALGQAAACGGYPARPTNHNIPNPLLAAYYPTLNPLLTLFNDAMTNVRLAIDLWIDVCSRPQPERGVVGQATVQGALEAVNVADAQFAELRARINELLPALQDVGPNECLFTFRQRSEVLPLIASGQLVTDSLDGFRRVVGYCFDATVGQSLRFEYLQASGNASVVMSVSPLDNPTNFIATGQSTGGQNLLSISPVVIPFTGRYLLVIGDTNPGRTEPLQSNFGVLITNVTGVTVIGPGLGIDPLTNQIIQLSSITQPISTQLPGVIATPVVGGIDVTCPNLSFSCQQLTTCDQAYACLAAGNFTLDLDANNVPCDQPQDVNLLCGN
ncbi:MAG: SH3 domain-containing protein [Anaerolineae bacterium]|nr:SH3 domain-containing protein [Anaerolineae bacterium]